MHLRVPFAVFVLGRTGRIRDPDIHNHSGTDSQPILLKIRIDQHKQLVPQVVRLQQMAKLALSGLVRRRFAAQVNAHEATHGPRVVQGFFHSGIGQVEPLFRKMDTQRPLQLYWRLARALRFGVKRLDYFAQSAPWNHLIQIDEKLVSARGFAVTFNAFICEGLLAYPLVLRDV